MKISPLSITILALTFFAGMFAFKTLTTANWTLMVCEESSDNLTCNKNAYIESGFRSLESCRKAGNLIFRHHGHVFECGKNCSPLEGYPGDLLCNPLCDREGCSD